MCDVYGDACLREEMFTSGFITMGLNQKDNPCSRNTLTFRKRKVPSAAVSKEGHLSLSIVKKVPL